MGRQMVMALVLGAAAVAAGVFGGQYLWHSYQAQQAAAAAAAAKAAAEAEANSPMGKQRAAVLEKLHRPETAVFRNVQPPRPGSMTWCGEVSARNMMGGQVGFTRYMVFVIADGEQVTYASAELDPKTDRSAPLDPMVALFDENWKEKCGAK